jgi:hypothetical protein
VQWACNYDSIRAALTQTACGRHLKHLLSSLLALATPVLWKAVYGLTVKGDPQDNPRESNTENQAGCSAREWNGSWETHAKMQAFTHAGTMQVCTYVRMNCRWCALSPLSCAHSDLIISFPIMLVLVLFDKHGTWSWWVECSGFQWIHAQKQTQRWTRLKGKQKDCNIKEVGGKRVRIHSGERYVL